MDNTFVDILPTSSFLASSLGFGAELRLREKINGFTIDLCDVPDRSPFKYELAVFHPDFENGIVVIVGYAADEDEARELFLNYCNFIAKVGHKIQYLKDYLTGEIYERSNS